MKNPFKKDRILTQTEIDIQRINLLLMQTDPNDPDFEILSDRKKVLCEIALLEAQAAGTNNKCNNLATTVLQTAAGGALAIGLSKTQCDKIHGQNDLFWNSVKKINFFDVFKNRR